MLCHFQSKESLLLLYKLRNYDEVKAILPGKWLLSTKVVNYIKFKILLEDINIQFVGNKAKGRISKRVFQESKARQNFPKTNISYLLIRTRGGKECLFF